MRFGNHPQPAGLAGVSEQGPFGAGLTELIVDIAVADAVVLVVLAVRWLHNCLRVRRSRRFAASGRTGEVNPNYRRARYTRVEQWDSEVLTKLGGLSRADAFAQILAIQGFDSLPTVELRRPALRAAGYRRVYRGIHGRDSSHTPRPRVELYSSPVSDAPRTSSSGPIRWPSWAGCRNGRSRCTV